MKKLFVFACLSIPVFAFAQTETATVKGVLSNLKNPVSTVYYMYRTVDDRMTDSAKVVAGKFSFKLNAEMPVAVTLLAVDPTGDQRPTKKEVATVYLQKGVNTVTLLDSFSNAQVKESLAHAEYLKLSKAQEPFRNQLSALAATYPELQKANDTAGMKKLEADFDAIQDKMKAEVYGNYVKDNPNSPMALYALEQFAGYDIDPKKIEPLFSGLSATSRNTPAGKRFADRIEIAKNTAVGAIAPEFSQADTSGKQVALSSFRGKYVLVDFWASWCGPCRAENPNVVAAFNKYKDKNFTVLGVSLDDAERDGAKKWLAAITKDKLTWTQVSDLKFWDNAVAKQYGIRAIPQNLLLDPSGKIVAKNITGDALQSKLAELLN